MINNSTIQIPGENQAFLKKQENAPIYKAIEQNLVYLFCILNIINIKCWFSCSYTNISKNSTIFLEL